MRLALLLSVVLRLWSPYQTLLDNLHLAGARFEAIIARLAGGGVSRAAA